jgi:hypothetical protein
MNNKVTICVDDLLSKNPVVRYVNETRPEDVVVALSEYEATDICWRMCGWWSEDISKCFNCNCPLALADKEAARLIGLQIRQMQQIAAMNRCNQLRVAAVIAACT